MRTCGMTELKQISGGVCECHCINPDNATDILLAIANVGLQFIMPGSVLENPASEMRRDLYIGIKATREVCSRMCTQIRYTGSRCA